MRTGGATPDASTAGCHSQRRKLSRLMIPALVPREQQRRAEPRRHEVECIYVAPLERLPFLGAKPGRARSAFTLGLALRAAGI